MCAEHASISKQRLVNLSRLPGGLQVTRDKWREPQALSIRPSLLVAPYILPPTRDEWLSKSKKKYFLHYFIKQELALHHASKSMCRLSRMPLTCSQKGM